MGTVQRSKASFSSLLAQRDGGESSPRSLPAVEVERAGRSFTSQSSTQPPSPTASNGKPGHKVSQGSGSNKGMSRTVSSFLKQLFKTSQDGHGMQDSSSTVQLSKSSQSFTAGSKGPEDTLGQQAKRQASLKPQQTSVSPSMPSSPKKAPSPQAAVPTPHAAPAAPTAAPPPPAAPSSTPAPLPQQAPQQATASRAPADKTVLLALSPNLPPSMQRASWSLKDYAVVEKMYTGYASTVYKAWCKHSGETVCLKAYNMSNLCELNRFQIYREVKLHSSLQHENIITLFAAFQQGDQVVLVQEYADAGDLFLLLHRYGGKLPERTAVEMVLHPFLCVLNYLHQNMVVHRDIKPENVLFTRTMALKLCDFGLAIDLKEERAVTRAGTLEYMAPEVLNCPFKNRPEENKDNTNLYYDLMVDTWAVGVLTYELLVGFPPFNDKQRAAIEDKIRLETPRFPSTMSELSRNFIMRSLQKDAMERPTILELLQHPWIKAHRRNASMRNLHGPGVARPGTKAIRGGNKGNTVAEEEEGMEEEDPVDEMRGPAGDLIRAMPATMSFTVGHSKPKMAMPEQSHLSFSSQNPKLAALRAGVL